MQPTPCTPAQRARQVLRRKSPQLIAFLLVGVYFLARFIAEQYAAATVPAQDADTATAQISGQWLNLSGPISKLLLALIFFAVSRAASWISLKVAPVLPDWAKGQYPEVGDYKSAFLGLADQDKLGHYARAEWKEMARFGICLLAAALVQ